MAMAEAWSREDTLVFQTWRDPDVCGTATVRRGRVVPARGRHKTLSHPLQQDTACSAVKHLAAEDARNIEIPDRDAETAKEESKGWP